MAQTKKYSSDCPRFFCNPGLYELWENRFEDKPVTTKELYQIVEEVAMAIDHAKSEAVWSGYGGN